MHRYLTFICGFSGLVFAGGTATASTFSEFEKAYRSVSVNTPAECQPICGNEKKCRGMIAFTPDTRFSASICYLYDGLEPGAPFEIKPPAPLDLQKALSDLNRYRAQKGLKPVRLNQKLNGASQAHVNDLARHGVLAHEGTDGSSHADRLTRQGYKFWSASENVAAGQKSWEQVFEGWQKSPGHDANLLQEDATEFGVALAFNPKTRYANYWAMLMATPRD